MRQLVGVEVKFAIPLLPRERIGVIEKLSAIALALVCLPNSHVADQQMIWLGSQDDEAGKAIAHCKHPYAA